jgi:cobalt-zinc-cadmium efflux system protein
MRALARHRRGRIFRMMSHAHSHPHEPGHDGHDHAHDHAHAHGAPRFGAGHHHHGPANYDRAFAIGVSLNLAFVIAEAIYGLRADSLALLADAGHNLSDVLGLALAWTGSVLARRGRTPDCC